MTAPRQVLPGTVYLVTRRCLHRQFLLRPGALVNQVFAYVLAVAARRYGLKVHAFCVLSNHYHLVVTDPHARLPVFQQFLDAFVARALNASLGRWETFWAPHSFSAVALGTPGDVIAKVAYTLANPVSAGLVQAGHLWPGLRSGPEAIGGAMQVSRPAHFFSPRSSLPETIELELEVPGGFLSPEDFRDQLQSELARQEQAARRENSVFVGVDRVLRQSPFGRPQPGEPRRGLSPRVASRDRWKRIELLQRLKGFLSEYREALAAWRERRRGTMFPAGTYLMRVAHGAACAAAP